MHPFTKAWLKLFVLLMFLTSCEWNKAKTLATKAEIFESEGKYRDAFDAYEKLIHLEQDKRKTVKYAKSATDIAINRVKNFDRAIYFAKYVILNSDSPDDRIAAQKNLADIYFSLLPTPNYQKSIEEFSKLLKLPIAKEDKFDYRVKMAKAYFRINNFYQAQVEIDNILENITDRNQKYDLKKLKADILLSSKDLAKAIPIYVELLKDFPKESLKDDIALNLAVCYEDQERYDKAIETLTELKKDTANPEFIDLRIKRLKEREAQQPGAHGLRK